MSHQHRAYIRHHVRPLIESRRSVTVELPDGRALRGHRATRTETPPGTRFRWSHGAVWEVVEGGGMVEVSRPAAPAG